MPSPTGTLTNMVIDATGPNANPRLAHIMPSLVRRLHKFARDVNFTINDFETVFEVVGAFYLLSPTSANRLVD